MKNHSLFNPKSIRRLLIPLIFEQFMIVMVGMVDTMLLSDISESALAAFSLVDSINLLLMQFFMAVGAGGSIIAAQYIGQNNRKGAENTAVQTVLMVMCIAVFIALPSIIFSGSILGILYPKISQEIMRYAKQYFILSAISYPFYGLYNAGTSMLYAQGYSKLSMITSVVMNSAKISLNYLLVVILKLEIQGAGTATILSRIIGAFMVSWFLIDQHAPIHFPKPFKVHFNVSDSQRILKVALPSGIENIIFLACKLFIGMMIAGYSSAMIAANAASNTISTYVSIPANAINLATITIVSQCIGAGRRIEAKQAAIKLQIATCISIAVMGGLIAVFLSPIIRVLNLNQEASEITYRIILVYVLVSAFLWTPSFGIPNSLRAAGDNRFVMYSATFSVVIVRTLGSWVLGTLLGFQVEGIWYAMYLDWAVRSSFFIYRFGSEKWLQHRLLS